MSDFRRSLAVSQSLSQAFPDLPVVRPEDVSFGRPTVAQGYDIVIVCTETETQERLLWFDRYSRPLRVTFVRNEEDAYLFLVALGYDDGESRKLGNQRS